ncbi:MAG: stage II sporulation protein R [Desulfotomaculaceae bacterium]|nr:stage II sporulation protein R [Desulfotomaculaceae bacterium]
MLTLCVFEFFHKDSVTIFPSGQLIRLHIVANSDREIDQELKRKVRDEIIRGITADFREAENIDTARVIALSRLDTIREITRRAITMEGKDYPVEVNFGKYSFPTKHYGSFVLPAGDYESVQVVIGSGSGANWWCVLFPPLCFIDMSKEVLISPIDDANAADKASVDNENYYTTENKITSVVVQASGVTGPQISNNPAQSSSTEAPGTTKVEFRLRIIDFLKYLISTGQSKTGG